MNLVFSFLLQATSGIDTTSSEYQFGRQIGSYIPVTIILIIAVIIILKKYKHQ